MSSTLAAELDRGWAALAAGEDAADEKLSVPSLALPVDCGHGPVRLALGSQGERRLLIPLSPSFKVPTGLGGEGIAVSEARLETRQTVTRFLDVLCTVDRLDDVFGLVVDRVIARLKEGTKPTDAVAGVLEDLRELLRQRRQARGKEQTVGLIGELLILRDLVHVSTVALKRWTGPTGRHDFGGLAGSIESKATTRRRDRLVKINSIDQLLPTPAAPLYLAVAVLEELPAGDLSVSGLVTEIKRSGIDSGEFDRLLALSGLDPTIPPQADELHFRIVDRSWYRVLDGFPRLVPESFTGGRLPDGVITCEYLLDLVAALPWLMKPEEASAVIREVAAR